MTTTDKQEGMSRDRILKIFQIKFTYESGYGKLTLSPTKGKQLYEWLNQILIHKEKELQSLLSENERLKEEIERGKSIQDAYGDMIIALQKYLKSISGSNIKYDMGAYLEVYKASNKIVALPELDKSKKKINS